MGSDVIEQLTPRELEILTLIGHGLSRMQIASRLGISYNTVRTHTVAIYGKLAVNNRVQAAVAAYKMGLVEDEEHWQR